MTRNSRNIQSWNTKHSLKAVFRNALMQVGGERLMAQWWRLRGHPSDHIIGSLKDRFSHIYQTGLWSGGDLSKTLSGPGSTLEATNSIRASLPLFLSRIHARSVLDVGCGDFTWMRLVDVPCPYLGLDIVDSVIAQNEREFGGEARKFAVMDACVDPLPKADVILCREVMFHLSFFDLRKLMANLRRTEARFIIATTDLLASLNVDIPSGDHSARNLSRAPFDLGQPSEYIADDDLVEGRKLGVWRL